MNGLEVLKDSLKGHHGNLDVAELFEQEVEEGGRRKMTLMNSKLDVAMPVPSAPPEHACLGTLVPHFWPSIISGEWERTEAIAAEATLREFGLDCTGPEEVDALMQSLRESGAGR
ncbi:hypothetical protein RUND412_004572 [Rhizina undulata]